MISTAKILPPEQFRTNRIIWLVIALSAVVNLGLMKQMGIKPAVADMSQFLVMMGIMAAVSLLFCYAVRDDTLCLFGNVMNQIISASLAISPSIYLGTLLAFPLADKRLISIDRFMGFPWQNYVSWVDRHATLAEIFTYSYSSFALLAVILVCGLFLINQSAHAQRFTIAFYLGGMVTALLATLFPAVGGYVYYGAIAHFAHMDIVAAHKQEVVLLEALRHHHLSVVPIPGPGIVVFPSFHAIMAVLLIYASLPFRYFRFFAIPINIFTLLSLPFDGGHYLIDALVGIVVALVCIHVAERILPRRA